MKSRRLILTPSDERSLPLYIESIGINADQEPIERPEGYRYFHWLQTLNGEGVIAYEGRTAKLGPGTGALVRPQVPHRYRAAAGCWQTVYLTFGGSLASEIASALLLKEADAFSWEPDTPFASLLADLLDTLGRTSDPFGIEASSGVYRFLLTLQKYGSRANGHAAVARSLDRLKPLTEWLELHYADPGIGLVELGAVLGVSRSTVNALFRETYNLTPYAYLLHLRLRKAKELLLNRPGMPVREIAADVGFRDASHFVATFRRSFGMPPEQYRRLN